MRPFTLDEIKNAAMSLDSRFDLGDYVMRGPQENLMELESRLSWSSVAAQLHHQGFTMVTVDEYAKTYDVPPVKVFDRIEKEGTLFALLYTLHDESFYLVPLAEREEPPPSEERGRI